MRRSRNGRRGTLIAACLAVGLAGAAAAPAMAVPVGTTDDPYSPIPAAPVRVNPPERLIVNDLIGNGDQGLMLDGSYTNFDARTANWIAPAGSLASLRFSVIDTSRAGGYRLSGKAMCVADKPGDRTPHDCGGDRSDIAYVEQTVTEPSGRTLTYRIWDARRAPERRNSETADLSKVQRPGDLNHDGRYDASDLTPFTVAGYNGFSWTRTSYRLPGQPPAKVTATLPNHWHQSYRVDQAADGSATGVLTIHTPAGTSLAYTFAGTASSEATRGGLVVRYRPSSSWRGTPTVRWNGSQNGERVHGSLRMTSTDDGWWRAVVPDTPDADLSLTFNSGLRWDTNHGKGYHASGALSSVSVANGHVSAIA